MRNTARLWVIGGVVLATIFVLMPVLGWTVGSGGDGHGMAWGVGWMWFMPLFMVVFWGLVIWAVVALVQGTARHGDAESSGQESALEILKQRYARGEIDKEEYQEKKRDMV